MALHEIKLKSHEPREKLTTWKLLLVLTMLEIDSSSEDLICEFGLWYGLGNCRQFAKDCSVVFGLVPLHGWHENMWYWTKCRKKHQGHKIILVCCHINWIFCCLYEHRKCSISVSAFFRSNTLVSVVYFPVNIFINNICMMKLLEWSGFKVFYIVPSLVNYRHVMACLRWHDKSHGKIPRLKTFM